MNVSIAEFVLERHPLFLLAGLSSLAILLHKLFMRVHFRTTLVANRAKVRVEGSKFPTAKESQVTTVQAIRRK